jgi:LysR family transcriptional regulator, glycine cleavage system transcriptional activator
MRYPVPSLPALHAFEAAARLGSFTAAAHELHLAPSTVSHRVRELESQLGVALFERLPRRVRLTDPGKAYVPVVRGVLEELTKATAGLFGSPDGGRVVVRVPISYGVAFLASRLPDFTSHHDVRVSVVSAIWSEETPDLEVDLEVQFQAEQLAPAGSEPLGGERALLVGPTGATALPPAHRDADGRGWSRVLVLGHEALWDEPDVVSVRPSFTGPDVTVDTWSAAIELVAHGSAHCALIPELMARGAIERGRVEQLGLASRMRESYHLVRVERPGGPTPEPAAFAAWLRDQHRTASAR